MMLRPTRVEPVKGDLVDVHVLRDGGTCNGTETGNDVDDTGRETSLDDELAHLVSRKRCLFGGLEDDGVTVAKGGTELPCEHEQGEVPRDDLTADTDRLVTSVVETLVVDLHDLSVVLVSPTTVVAEVGGDGSDIEALGNGESLAVVERLDSGELVNVLLNEVGELHKKLATSITGRVLTPDGLESLTSGLDSDIDILGGSLGDLTNLFSGGRVDGGEGLAVESGDELVVDEQVGLMVDLIPLGRSRLRVGMAGDYVLE